jgi:hypothetical protein
MHKQALPVSPEAPGMLDLLKRRQLDYIAAERWRYTRALEHIPAYSREAPMSGFARGMWGGWGLWPMTPNEITKRLAQLDEMEAAVENLTMDDVRFACDLTNAPA